MVAITDNELSSMLSDVSVLRVVEPHIYSVLPDNESGNEYDSQFGSIYDMVACNPVYNRLIWGYSIKIFPRLAAEALRFSRSGPLLDIGCGSLAFTAKTYCQHPDRPVVLADQSLKMLRMAKAKLQGLGGVPANLVFLHADALQLPFKENVFTTILSENLLHCLRDTGTLLTRLKAVMSEHGRMFFTTLVRADRFADKYLVALAKNGKLVARSVADHRRVFQQIGLAAEYETAGNLVVLRVSI
jgi:ubiquinone/menaquinone biosynthesis C-methylase UbiE